MNNKKAWLIGCGGCLSVIIIIAIVAGIFIYSSVSELKNASDKTAQGVFGEKLPEGYFTIGIPVESKKQENNLKMVMMMNTQRQTMVFAVDTFNKNPEQLNAINTANPEELKVLMEGFLEQSNSSNKPNGIRQIDPIQLGLTGGKTYPAFDIVLEDKKGNFSPIVATFLMYPSNRMVVLMGMDPNAASESPDTDFSGNFETLQGELQSLIDSTALKDNLSSPIASGKKAS
jgi:hypothetical protein